MRKSRFIGRGLLIAGCLLWATARGQSVFSARGFGEQLLTSDAVSQGRGGLVTSSISNPAYPVGSSKTGVWLSGFGLAGLAVQNQGERLFGAGRPSLFLARVPLPLGLRVGFGFTERFNQDFDIYSDSLASHRRHAQGQGGIYDLNVSVARAFFGVVSLGATYSRWLGVASEYWRLDVFEGGYVTVDTGEYVYRGNALRLGGYCELPGVSFGGFCEPTFGLSVDCRGLAHNADTSAPRLAVRFPAQFGAGVMFELSETWRLYLDGAAWNARRIAVGETTRQQFEDAFRLAVGAEYQMSEKHPLRLGVSCHKWYLSAAGGRPILEFGLVVGSAVPLSRLGSADFSVGYGLRSAGGMTENLLKAVFSLSFEELWHRRKRGWGY